jgi:homoserine dehydrogenase
VFAHAVEGVPLAQPRSTAGTSEVRLGLLGLGQIGSAIARLVESGTRCAGRTVTVAAALVRDTTHIRATSCPVTDEPSALLAGNPDVLIEVLGGVEPARTIVRAALSRGIPVVTANKSLLAAHGDELFEVARRSGSPLLYEASALAGVPFLGTFARRPLAARASGIVGIVNGTSNFLLSALARGATFADALAEAQRLGFAEPDPSNDVDGIDAAEKLTLLVRHFAGASIRPSELPRTPVSVVTPADLQHAGNFGGVLKPVVSARWRDGSVSGAVGPAFVWRTDPLALLEGELNGLRLEREHAAPLFFSGPGAGPDVTAATILDDVSEILEGAPAGSPTAVPARIEAPTAGWFVRLRSDTKLPHASEIYELLASRHVRVARWGLVDTSRGGEEVYFLAFPCVWTTMRSALDEVETMTTAQAQAFPVVECGPLTGC